MGEPLRKKPLRKTGRPATPGAEPARGNDAGTGGGVGAPAGGSGDVTGEAGINIDELINVLAGPDPVVPAPVPESRADFARAIIRVDPGTAAKWGRTEYPVLINVKTGHTLMRLHDGSTYNVQNPDFLQHARENPREHLLAEGIAVTLHARIQRPDLYENTTLPPLPFDLNEERAAQGLPAWEPTGKRTAAGPTKQRARTTR